MRWRESKFYLLVLLTVYTGPIFGCAFRKLVEAAQQKKLENNSQTVTKDIIEDPIPPKWTTDPNQRQTDVRNWELHVLEEAEKRWTAFGVKYERIPYGDGEALRVLETGDSPLNAIYNSSKKRADKTGYPFNILFSPRSLVQEWPEKDLHFLVGGSFRGDTNTIHLSFSSVEEKPLNAIFHHEYLHAIFDYYRAHGNSTAFNGRFASRNGKTPMWKGVNYTSYMSLEELATFPVNLRLYELRLREIEAEPNPDHRAKMAKHFVTWVWGHSLTNAVNSEHASNTIGHIIRHLGNGLRDVAMGAKIRRGNAKEPWAITATFSFANISYQIEVPEQSMKGLIPELSAQAENDASKMAPELSGKIGKILLSQLARQYEMAHGAASSGDSLMRGLISFSEKPKITDSDMAKLSELLLATRTATLPYIKPKPR